MIFVNQALRDRLICELVNHNIQKKLLTEANLTLTKALEIAKSMEAAEVNMKKLQISNPAQIHAVQSSTRGADTATSSNRARPLTQPKNREEETPSYKRSCHRCGVIGHHPST